jgi:hypothetical protein
MSTVETLVCLGTVGTHSVLSERPLDRPRRGLHHLPTAFFIFANLSVSTAGEHRLLFTLIKMEKSFLNQGSMVPTIDTVTSQIFSVVNTRGFDQVQPSTNLVKLCLERGAEFPLRAEERC